MRYDILVVIYKTLLSKSDTFNSLLRSLSVISGSKITIWDNSPSSVPLNELENYKDLLANHEIELIYVNTPENLTLSDLYNRYRSRLNESNNEFVIIFDQDTKFDKYFFIKHSEAVKTLKVKLYLPKIVFKSKYISPAYFFCFKGFFFKKIKSGLMSSRFKTAINSSMIIEREYFTQIFKGYPIELKYYGTDDYFMNEYREFEKLFYVLDYDINHDLTYSFDSDCIDKVIERYKESNKALMFNARSCSKYSVRFFLFVRSLYLAIKYRRVEFLDY